MSVWAPAWPAWVQRSHDGPKPAANARELLDLTKSLPIKLLLNTDLIWYLISLNSWLCTQFKARMGMPLIIRKSSDRLPPARLARRHFMGIVAAGAGRLSTIAVSSAFLASKSADEMGIFPRDDWHDDHEHRDHDQRGHDHNCFGGGTLILTAHGEVPIEDLAIGELVMTTNG